MGQIRNSLDLSTQMVNFPPIPSSLARDPSTSSREVTTTPGLQCEWGHWIAGPESREFLNDFDRNPHIRRVTSMMRMKRKRWIWMTGCWVGPGMLGCSLVQTLSAHVIVQRLTMRHTVKRMLQSVADTDVAIKFETLNVGTQGQRIGRWSCPPPDPEMW